MSGYDTNAGAMTAFAQGLNVTAHNIANMNTPDFRAWSRVYNEGQSGSGPRLSTQMGENALVVRDEMNISSLAPSPDYDMGLSLGVNSVNAAREMTNLMIDQRAFEGNAAAISTREDMDLSLMGSMVNEKV